MHKKELKNNNNNLKDDNNIIIYCFILYLSYLNI